MIEIECRRCGNTYRRRSLRVRLACAVCRLNQPKKPAALIVECIDQYERRRWFALSTLAIVRDRVPFRAEHKRCEAKR